MAVGNKSSRGQDKDGLFSIISYLKSSLRCKSVDNTVFPQQELITFPCVLHCGQEGQRTDSAAVWLGMILCAVLWYGLVLCGTVHGSVGTDNPMV